MTQLERLLKVEKLVNTIQCRLREIKIESLHNKLNGLQGGEGENYYHLTKEDYDTITDKNIGVWVFDGVFTQEFNNVFN